MTDASGTGSPPPSNWPPPADPPTSWEAPPPEPGPAPGIAFAPHGTRLIAYIIDSIIVGLAFTAVIVIAALVAFAGTSLSGLREIDIDSTTFNPALAGPLFGFFGLAFLLGILVWGYFPYFWWKGGQTLGMKLFNLYVVRDADGGPLSGGQAVLRLLGLWVAAAVFYIGFLWVFVDARRRGWQDLIAGTCVIERQR
jgi:uncharacterized RDD family membrane protein YckC